jgi:predicted transcriptional regulator
MKPTITNDEGFKKFLQVIGTNLRDAREKQNLKINTVAKAMKISGDQLDQIEKGQIDWEVDLIGRLCLYYKVSVKDIATDNQVSDET